MKDMTERLERIDARLAELNARNNELKEQLAGRAAEREDLFNRLTAEMSAFDTETQTIKARRAEVKTDYGLLFETAGQLRKGVEAFEAEQEAAQAEPAETDTE